VGRSPSFLCPPMAVHGFLSRGRTTTRLMDTGENPGVGHTTFNYELRGGAAPPFYFRPGINQTPVPISVGTASWYCRVAGGSSSRTCLGSLLYPSNATRTGRIGAAVFGIVAR